MKWYKFKRKKPISKTGKSPKDKAKARAWRMFSDYIRLRDCLFTTGTSYECACVTCGRRKPYAEIDAGHFIPGRRNAVLFCDFGTNGQCRHCNRYLDGDYAKYKSVMVSRHGAERIENYEILAKVPKYMSETDFNNVHNYYKAELAKLRGGA